MENFTTDAYMAMMPTLVDLYYGIFLWCRLSVTPRKRQANSLCTKPSKYGTRSLSATLARNSILSIGSDVIIICSALDTRLLAIVWGEDDQKELLFALILMKKIRCEGSMYVCNAICLSELSKYEPYINLVQTNYLLSVAFVLCVCS